MIDFAGLNCAQEEAVRNINGPTLIIAGAGSGKTKVLTLKIAYLLEQGVSPNAILALTFTNKASREMKERVISLIGKEKGIRLWMGTFHSIFIRFLREHSDLIGYPSSFTIYDQSDSRSAIRASIKELQLDDKVYKPAEVLSRISLAKNNLITAKAYMSNSELIQFDSTTRKGRICDIYELYAKKCRTAGVMDFDDILLNMNILIRDHPEVADKLAEQFRYILVDEYQDTNYAQYLIVKKISSRHKNISVVGDDSQSIYGFRGARIQNILNFQKDYPDSKIFRLEQNYRSTQTIVNAANSVIAKNNSRIKKVCFSQGTTGEKIEVIRAFTEQDEASSVASSIISRIYSDKASYSHFAILYRTNAQSRAFEEALRKKNLPYKIYAGHSFYERAEVKDLLAYFRLLVNPTDDEAFRRVVNVPGRGIGDTTIGYLSEAASKNNTSLWGALSLQNLEEYGVRNAALVKLNAFANMINHFREKVPLEDAYSVALGVATGSGFLTFLKDDTSIEGQSRFENAEELLSSINSFVEDQTKLEAEIGNEGAFISLESYLENVALLTDLETSDDSKDDNNRIQLMTVHASKGLEFPYIYIVGMEENLFPSSLSINSVDEIEEERRLFYVALTRAMKGVSLSFSRSRFRWGQYVNYPPSRFLREIEKQYLLTPIEESEFGSNGSDFPFGSGASGSNWGSGSGRGSNAADSRFERGASGNNWGSGSGRGSNTADSPYGKGASGSNRSTGNTSSWRSGTGQGANHPVVTPKKERVVTHPPTLSRPIQEADPSFAPDSPDKIRVGQKVEHNRFGFGTIEAIENPGSEAKATINFEIGGNKVLLLKYAKLRIIS